MTAQSKHSKQNARKEKERSQKGGGEGREGEVQEEEGEVVEERPDREDVANEIRLAIERIESVNIVRHAEPGPAHLAHLPSYERTSDTPFVWGPDRLDGEIFAERIQRAWLEVVCFRRNIFNTPSGSVGKAVIAEKARLFEACERGNPLEHIALKAVAVMEHLLFQKTHKKAKAADNVSALCRRLLLWEKGEIDQILS